jgi:hypothetical protein
MGLYEFRTISHGKTIRTVEHYCEDNSDALKRAAKSVGEFEITVWQHGHPIVVPGVEPT